MYYLLRFTDKASVFRGSEEKLFIKPENALYEAVSKCSIVGEVAVLYNDASKPTRDVFHIFNTSGDLLAWCVYFDVEEDKD